MPDRMIVEKDYQIPKYALAGMSFEPRTPDGSELDPPELSYDPRQKLWKLEKDYTYEYDGNEINVAADFKFDLSSVPRPFWWLIAPFELSIVAPLIHDYLYLYKGRMCPGATDPPKRYTRKEADALFLRIMDEEGIARWKRSAAYRVVRTFSGIHWKSGDIPSCP